MNGNSTTPPFSGTATSTAPLAPSQYIYSPPLAPTAGVNGESKFPWSEVITVAGFIVAGIVGYFSAIISLKSDIAENKENISVIKTSLDSLSGDVQRIEKGVGQTERLAQDQAGVVARLNALEKDVGRVEDKIFEKRR